MSAHSGVYADEVCKAHATAVSDVWSSLKILSQVIILPCMHWLSLVLPYSLLPELWRGSAKMRRRWRRVSHSLGIQDTSSPPRRHPCE